MYRVYDLVNKQWVPKDKILISCFKNDIYMREKRLFGTEKLVLVSNEKFVVHKDTGALDKNNNAIYEGDICELEIENGIARCVVAYVPERAAYFLFDDDNEKYYNFNEGISGALSIVGNVFEHGEKDEEEEE